MGAVESPWNGAFVAAGWPQLGRKTGPPMEGLFAAFLATFLQPACDFLATGRLTHSRFGVRALFIT